MELSDKEKKDLVIDSVAKPSENVLAQAQAKNLTIYGMPDQNNTQEASNTPKEANPQSPQQDSLQNPQYSFIPTGVAYFDKKLSDGKGFNFIEAYIARNMLGIDLRAHINANVDMKQDQKMRNMTSLYQELYKTTKAIDSIDRTLSSDLYHLSGYGGAIKEGLRNVAGAQWDEKTENARTNMSQAVVDVANATKVAGVTGKDHIARIEDRFYKSLTDSRTRGRALMAQRDQLETNMINLYRTIAQMGGDPQMQEQMANWYKNSQTNKAQLQERYKLKDSKVYDESLEREIRERTNYNPFVSYALGMQDPSPPRDITESTE